MVTGLALQIMQGPFVWGRSDCCTCACDVFARLHGIDPMAGYRGRYGSGFAAYRMIAGLGGWRALFDAMAARSGLVLVDGHAPGRLGLARVDLGFALVIGIEGGLWAGKVDGGMAAIMSEHVERVAACPS